MSEKITTEKICQLQGVAKTIRKNIVKMITEANSGHPGGSLSTTDILVYLYFNEMNVDSSNPQKLIVIVLSYVKVMPHRYCMRP